MKKVFGIQRHSNINWSLSEANERMMFRFNQNPFNNRCHAELLQSSRHSHAYRAHRDRSRCHIEHLSIHLTYCCVSDFWCDSNCFDSSLLCIFSSVASSAHRLPHYNRRCVVLVRWLFGWLYSIVKISLNPFPHFQTNTRSLIQL